MNFARQLNTYCRNDSNECDDKIIRSITFRIPRRKKKLILTNPFDKLFLMVREQRSSRFIINVTDGEFPLLLRTCNKPAKRGLQEGFYNIRNANQRTKMPQVGSRGLQRYKQINHNNNLQINNFLFTFDKRYSISAGGAEHSNTRNKHFRFNITIPHVIPSPQPLNYHPTRSTQHERGLGGERSQLGCRPVG